MPYGEMHNSMRQGVFRAMETQSPKGHLNTYTKFVQSRSSAEGEDLLEIIRLGVLNLL